MAIQTVDSSTAASSASTASSGTGAAAISKDDFLKILVAQLQHQDPLNPTDANEFVSELSQLTQVEMLQNIDADLAKLASATEKGSMGQWLSSIGSYMKVDSTSVSQGDEVVLSPSGTYDSLALVLEDSSGNQTTKTFSSTDTPVYSDTDGVYTIVGATATRNGVAKACDYSVYRLIAAVQSGTTGMSLVATDGTTYSTSDVTEITK